MKIQALRERFTVSSVNLILLLEIATVVPPCTAEAPNKFDVEFRTFYAQFSEAIRANNKNKITDLIAFPVKDWSVEKKGIVETIGIKDKADFLARYDSLFTPFIRSHVLEAKPQKLSDDRYMVMWQDADAEFSFQFKYVAGRGFRVAAYGIGPR
jgi:hypothetical protein